MRFAKIFLFAFTLLSINPLHAQDAADRVSGDKGNGGDEVSVGFVADYHQALLTLQARLPGLYRAIVSRLPEESKILVVTVDETLTVEVDGVEQKVMALNKPQDAVIYVNRGRWKMTKDAYLREAIALHEFLGLAGLESTGIYTYSAQLLALHRLDISLLVTGIPVSVDDFKVQTLRASPEYAKALVSLLSMRSMISGRMFVSRLLFSSFHCEESILLSCVRGVVSYRFAINLAELRSLKGGLTTRPIGVISANVRFVENSAENARGAWVEHIEIERPGMFMRAGRGQP